MLPIAAYYVRRATADLAHSAVPAAPVRPTTAKRAGRGAGAPARDRLATALRRAADRLEPTTS